MFNSTSTLFRTCAFNSNHLNIALPAASYLPSINYQNGVRCALAHKCSERQSNNIHYIHTDTHTHTLNIAGSDRLYLQRICRAEFIRSCHFCVQHTPKTLKSRHPSVDPHSSFPQIMCDTLWISHICLNVRCSVVWEQRRDQISMAWTCLNRLHIFRIDTNPGKVTNRALFSAKRRARYIHADQFKCQSIEFSVDTTLLLAGL